MGPVRGDAAETHSPGGSIGVRADDLAEVPRGELLEDAEPDARLDAVGLVAVAVVDDAGGIPGVIDRLRFDRILEEADRAVAEGEVGPAGVEAPGDHGPGLHDAQRVI